MGWAGRDEPRSDGRVTGRPISRRRGRGPSDAEDAAPLLPKCTVIKVTAWHDNTPGNPNDPDPEQWVGWGDRTVGEMAHAWVDVTYLEQEEFERLVAHREAKKAETDAGNR